MDTIIAILIIWRGASAAVLQSRDSSWFVRSYENRAYSLPSANYP